MTSHTHAQNRVYTSGAGARAHAPKFGGRGAAAAAAAEAEVRERQINEHITGFFVTIFLTHMYIVYMHACIYV